MLPVTAPIPVLDAIARAHGRQFQRLPSPSVEGQLEAGESYFLTTLGHCDCDAPLGQSRSRGSDEGEEARKLARKGWSAAKVARALAQKRESAEASFQARDGEALVRWTDFVRAVLASGHVRELGLVLHQYHGPLDEDVTLRERRRVKVTAALPEVLRDLDEDVLHLFHASDLAHSGRATRRASHISSGRWHAELHRWCSEPHRPGSESYRSSTGARSMAFRAPSITLRAPSITLRMPSMAP